MTDDKQAEFLRAWNRVRFDFLSETEFILALLSLIESDAIKVYFSLPSDCRDLVSTVLQETPCSTWEKYSYGYVEDGELRSRVAEALLNSIHNRNESQVCLTEADLPADTAAFQADDPKLPTLERVIGIVSEWFAIEQSSITPSTTLEQIDADELDVLELIVILAKLFGVRFADDAFLAVTSHDNHYDGRGELSMQKLAGVVDSAQTIAG
ncbi:acyl carrier protein [Mariniblastus fucicola]|uniref:Acyl carrier protein n=1 Tax=Mariniblastus fucicola TaxID=980251 RepID=A0A5B9P9N1_9BACT|nr:acyl carrier protein [Mariniblastus fucicola]QEG21945.1 acyl carrier protein [Mariniblastus fucicola]